MTCRTVPDHAQLRLFALENRIAGKSEQKVRPLSSHAKLSHQPNEEWDSGVVKGRHRRQGVAIPAFSGNRAWSQVGQTLVRPESDWARRGWGHGELQITTCHLRGPYRANNGFRHQLSGIHMLLAMPMKVLYEWSMPKLAQETEYPSMSRILARSSFISSTMTTLVLLTEWTFSMRCV